MFFCFCTIGAHAVVFLTLSQQIGNNDTAVAAGRELSLPLLLPVRNFVEVSKLLLSQSIERADMLYDPVADVQFSQVSTQTIEVPACPFKLLVSYPQAQCSISVS